LLFTVCSIYMHTPIFAIQIFCYYQVDLNFYGDLYYFCIFHILLGLQIVNVVLSGDYFSSTQRQEA